MPKKQIYDLSGKFALNVMVRGQVLRAGDVGIAVAAAIEVEPAFMNCCELMMNCAAQLLKNAQVAKSMKSHVVME